MFLKLRFSCRFSSRFVSGRPFLPARPLKVSLFLARRASKSPTRKMESPVRAPSSTTPSAFSANDSQDLFPDLTAQGRGPLIHWSKPQRIDSEPVRTQGYTPLPHTALEVSNNLQTSSGSLLEKPALTAGDPSAIASRHTLHLSPKAVHVTSSGCVRPGWIG